MSLTIGIIGLGFVGGAIVKSFSKLGVKLVVYDKYKNGGIGSLKKCLIADIIFLCLPTPFNVIKKSYDKSSLEETCTKLVETNYKGLVVLKSTVEPLTSDNLWKKYKLNIIHNPEFLTAATAFEDFHNQKHIVIGRQKMCGLELLHNLCIFYRSLYPNAVLSLCNSTESECMKLFVNNFYASKIQIFNEFYLTCKKLNINYENVKKMMLQNGWINPMHTKVPGTDGELSYGGYCFPKDTSALVAFMDKHNISNEVLQAVVNERDKMRSDKTNILLEKSL